MMKSSQMSSSSMQVKQQSSSSSSTAAYQQQQQTLTWVQSVLEYSVLVFLLFPSPPSLTFFFYFCLSFLKVFRWWRSSINSSFSDFPTRLGSVGKRFFEDPMSRWRPTSTRYSVVSAWQATHTGYQTQNNCQRVGLSHFAHYFLPIIRYRAHNLLGQK